MQIAQHTVVTLNYTLTDDDGDIIDQAQDGSFAYLHGASNIIPGLEKALEGKRAGDQVQVNVEPEEGYGEHNEALIQVVPRDAFPENEVLEAGMQFHAEGPNGQPIIVTIADVEGDEVTIDGNHPLAGTTLNFDVTVIEVRAASEEEKTHGHVHGAHGHHHD